MVQVISYMNTIKLVRGDRGDTQQRRQIKVRREERESWLFVGNNVSSADPAGSSIVLVLVDI